MNKIVSFLSCLLLCSCNFSTKAPSEEELLNKRLQEINWNEVTRYPSVVACDTLLDKIVQKDCFFAYLTQSIQQKLASDTLWVLYPEVDTIQVKVTVNTDGTLDFEPRFERELSYGNQKIDSIIRARLQGFNKIEPAQKEGIPVKTEFVLPVILKVE